MKIHFPKEGDSENEVNHKRDILFDEVLPRSIIPIALANSMLIIGSTGDDTCPHIPHLSTFLLASGAVSVTLVTFSIIMAYILDYILEPERFTETCETDDKYPEKVIHESRI